MKKSAFILLFLCMAVLPFYAQPGIGLGIKAGANFANLDVESASTKSITSYHVGAYLNINFSENFGITPELLYSAQGSKVEGFKVNYDFIAIPIMFRFLPVKMVSLEAGPQFSFLMKAEVEDVGDVKDQLKSNDFGLALGAGLHFGHGINLGARYVVGFTNMSDVSNETIRSRTFQLYVGWTFLGSE